MNPINELATAVAASATPTEILYLAPVDRDRALVRERFVRFGWPVVMAADAAAALRLAASRRFGMCVVDLSDDRTALASIRVLRAQAPTLPLVALVDPSNPSSAGEAINAGTFDVLPWPFEERDIASLLADARDVLAVDAAPSCGAITAEHLLIANSVAMRLVRDLVRGAAASTGSVLLVGEPGSGRALAARAIHEGGATADQPLVEIDCAAPSPQDLDRQLFGSAQGRRTHGRSDVGEVLGPGSAFVQARGGTLLLRNVLETPGRVQARLARLLRDQEAIVADDGELVELGVRVMASVETTVDGAVADGRLRRDLFERLSQVRIDIPPFRRRREDLPVLAAHMVRERCESRGLSPKSFSRSALSLVAALPWRGNGRELRELLDTLVGAVPRSVIQLDDVLAHARLDGGGTALEAGVTLRDARARFERECISAVLMRHHGRVGDAARALGIQRTNLYRKVRQLNVARSLLSARK
jgi:DNA-binding NtrC family response regulator